jgi:hypothetical protein
MRNKLFDLQRSSVSGFDRLRATLPSPAKSIGLALGALVGALAVFFVSRRVRHLGWRRGLKVWRLQDESDHTRVDFYQRLLKALEKQGIKRELYETPLEFASTVGISEAQAITRAYNRVRFGEAQLTDSERVQIEDLLSRIENGGSKD